MSRIHTTRPTKRLKDYPWLLRPDFFRSLNLGSEANKKIISLNIIDFSFEFLSSTICQKSPLKFLNLSYEIGLHFIKDCTKLDNLYLNSLLVSVEKTSQKYTGKL